MKKSDHDYSNARRQRRNLSLPEGLLWRELRRKQSGFKFRKQHPLSKLALDFYCAEVKLAIEVDGKSHDMGDRPERDEARDAFVRSQGIDVLRIAATDVLRSPTDAAEAILAACRERKG